METIALKSPLKNIMCMNEKVYSLWAGGPEHAHAGLFTVQECVANFAVIIRQFGVVVRWEDEKELLPIDTDFDHFAWVVLVLWKEKQEERLGTMHPVGYWWVQQIQWDTFIMPCIIIQWTVCGDKQSK